MRHRVVGRREKSFMMIESVVDLGMDKSAREASRLRRVGKESLEVMDWKTGRRRKSMNDLD